jgi:hypothetical protein
MFPKEIINRTQSQSQGSQFMNATTKFIRNNQDTQEIHANTK